MVGRGLRGRQWVRATSTASAGFEHGVSMIEVLVTLVIIAFGLLGMAGLQSRLQVSEMEAYQRAQALVLLSDMASRISTNRSMAAAYVSPDTAEGLGAGPCPSSSSSGNLQQTDVSEWCQALQGAAEVKGITKVGAVIGGRGCVQALGNGEYLIAVAWQGLVPLTAPTVNVSCGVNRYNGAAGSACVSDSCRRVVTTIVRIAPL